LAAAMLAAGAIMLLGASPAAAATSCAGSLIDSQPMTDLAGSGATYGTLYVYYDSSTGKNCAKATNSTGVSHDMIVWISRCAPGTGSSWYNCNTSDPFVQGGNYDRGYYHAYAGPVNTPGSAAGRCIEAYSQITVGTKTGTADIGGHCG
jgi:hypothetical protein